MLFCRFTSAVVVLVALVVEVIFVVVVVLAMGFESNLEASSHFGGG